MYKNNYIDALHVAGSIASLTGISLLALGSNTSDLEFITILAYAMSASIFLGLMGLAFFMYRYLYDRIEIAFGKIIAITVSAITIPLLIWLSFYLILILKRLSDHEFLWILGQITR